MKDAAPKTALQGTADGMSYYLQIKRQFPPETGPIRVSPPIRPHETHKSLALRVKGIGEAKSQPEARPPLKNRFLSALAS